MSNKITPTAVDAAARRVCQMFLANMDEFNRLDARTGDGDMGSSLAAVASAVLEDATPVPDDLGAAFSRVAAAIAKRSGSSLSALAMTGLMSLGKTLRGHTTAGVEELVPALREALSTMQTRSGAQFGDKTVLDGLKAMLDAARDASDLAALKHRFEGAISECIVEFRDRPTSVGRARLAPNKSVGLDDPGTVVLLRTIQTI
jgi:hypothetical protein